MFLCCIEELQSPAACLNCSFRSVSPKSKEARLKKEKDVKKEEEEKKKKEKVSVKQDTVSRKKQHSSEYIGPYLTTVLQMILVIKVMILAYCFVKL